MNMKSSAYPIAIAAVVGVVLLALGWSRFSISIETEGPETATLPALLPATPPTSTISGERSPEQIAQNPPKVASPESTPVTANPRGLRVSNQTEQPVRVALLSRQAAVPAAKKTAYKEPVHWDFAPGEGSSQGLILSLPEGDLKLKKGDVLVAFAQDGSRRYWGPYVVGETSLPMWEQQKSEWQLVLQP